MSAVEWSDQYNIGIQEIDEQHKCLLKLMNKLHDAIIKSKAKDEVGNIIEELIDYTKVHFAIEECLMRMFGYDGYEEHKVVHESIVQKVLHFKNKFESGDTAVGMELFLFLKNWLFDHINCEDKEYAPTLLKGGVKKSWIKKFFG